ncbi:MAG: hypothetical protein ACRDWB_07380 [Acidimicrobiales bacterium]
MDQFHRDRTQQVFPGGRPRTPGGGGEGQDRSETFSASCDEMGRYIIKESVACDDRLSEQGLKELDLFGQFGKTQELDGVH